VLPIKWERKDADGKKQRVVLCSIGKINGIVFFVV